jgi:hypothetical protein
LGEHRFHPTVGCEFLIVLSPNASASTQDRLALAKLATEEQSPASVVPQIDVLAQAPPATTASNAAFVGTEKIAIEDTYVRTVPSAQSALDILADSWVGALPQQFGLTAGEIGLCQDERVSWAIDQAGGVEGLDVLELGPLEASHTYMLLQRGAKSVLAIEANKRAFMKCLIVKEILALRDASFMLGDFVKFLDADSRSWPFIMACGVLYHMTDPIHVIEQLARKTDKLFIWTHVVDNNAMPTSDPRYGLIKSVEERPWNGKTIRLHTRPYGSTSDPKFCGGPLQDPKWLDRQELLMMLKALGYNKISIAHETPDHPAGPALSIFAQRIIA